MHVHKVFVEYKVSPEFREAYISFVRELQADQEGVEWLESEDQPCLFLEIWELQTEEQVAQFRQERLQETDRESRWTRQHRWIEGGPAKINVWRFRSTL